MKAQSEPSELLARKAIKGDKQAFGELVKLHKEYFYRNAFLYAKREEAALEVFQEAIVKALLSIKTLKEPTHFKTWMTKIIYNCAMDLHRSNTKTVYLEEYEEVPSISPDNLSREERLDLHAAVDKLDEPYQSVIVQKYFQGMKIDEIAVSNGRPVGTVKSDLARAKKQLRNILREGYRHV